MESGDSYYYNERHLTYKDNVVEVVPLIPIRSQLTADISALFDKPTSTLVPVIEHYKPDWLQGPHLISILMKSCDLKLLSILDRKLFRFGSSGLGLSVQHDPVRGYSQHYCFAFQSNQVAYRIEVFYERLLSEMSWDMKATGCQMWICDAYNPVRDSIETLIAIPRHASLVANCLSVAILIRTKQQHIAGFDWQGQRNSMAFILISLVNPQRQLDSTTQVPDGRSMQAVILFLKTLLAEPSSTVKIGHHDSFICRLIEYICSRDYTNVRTEKVSAIITFFWRTRLKSTDQSPFGDIGQLLLTWCLLPYLKFKISLKSHQQLCKLARGVGVENIKKMHDADGRQKLLASLELANELRSNAVQHRIFFKGDTIDPKKYQDATQHDVDAARALIEGFISDAARPCQYHPDFVFALMSFFCPVFECTSEYFENLFDHGNTNPVQPNTFNLLNFTHPVDATQIHMNAYSDSNSDDFQRKHDHNCMMIAALVGGMQFQDLDFASKMICDLTTQTQNGHYLMSNGRCRGNSVGDTLFLPFYTHQGAIVDPIIDSFLSQVQNEESITKRTRLTQDCPLFDHKKSPAGHNSRTTVMSPIYLSSEAPNSGNKRQRLDLDFSDSDSESVQYAGHYSGTCTSPMRDIL